MEHKRKLPRIQMGTKYTTGDNQYWTYEYTREDFVAALTAWPTAPVGSWENKLTNSIIQYFRDNHDIAKKYGILEQELNTLLLVNYN